MKNPILIAVAVIIISKYSCGFEKLWSLSITSSEYIDISSIDCNTTNNLVVTGCFMSKITFSNGLSFISNGSKDLFIAQYSLDGDIIWLRREGGEGTDRVIKTFVLHDSSILIFGEFDKKIIFQKKTSDSIILTPKSGNSFFLVKYSDSGELLFAKQILSSGDIHKVRINSLPNGDFAVSGTVGSVLDSGYINFTPNSKNPISVYIKDRSEIFLSVYSSEGDLLWAKMIETPTKTSNAESLCMTVSDDSIYLTGEYRNHQKSVKKGNMTRHYFYNNTKPLTYKYSFTGSMAWKKELERPSNGAVIITIKYIPKDTLLVLSKYNGITYVSKYDGDGNLIWERSIKIESSNRQEEQSIIHNKLDNSIIVRGIETGIIKYNGTVIQTPSCDEKYFFILSFSEHGDIIQSDYYSNVVFSSYINDYIQIGGVMLFIPDGLVYTAGTLTFVKYKNTHASYQEQRLAFVGKYRNMIPIKTEFYKPDSSPTMNAELHLPSMSTTVIFESPHPEHQKPDLANEGKKDGKNENH